MIIDILKDAIHANLGPSKPAPKGWLKLCCKLCHTQGHGKDSRFRFGIQFKPTTIAMNCFNCGFSASYTEGKSLSKSFKFFLKNLNVDEKLIEYIDFEIFKSKNKITIVRDGDEERVKEDTESKYKALFQRWNTRELPKDSLPISAWLEHGLADVDFLSVVNYAINRKIFDLDKFFWSPLKTNNLNQRIIIPYYYKNKIVGYTARLCYDTYGKAIPKYYQQCPEDFVYNLDNQQAWSRKYVIVTEGVLDAWVVDGVSILGEIGQSKIDIINRLYKNIIVCPDRDKKGWDLVQAALDNNWAVSFPKWQSNIKDAANAAERYGRLLTTHSIISSAITVKDKIKLKWDIDAIERKNRMLSN